MTRRAAKARGSGRGAPAREAVSDRTASSVHRPLARLRRVVLLAVVATLGAWLIVEMVRACRQRAAVEAVWALGGYVQRQHDRPGEDPLTPPWYRKLFGDEFENPVVLVRLAGTEASDDDLASVGTLAHLRMLDLRDTRITDRGLQHLDGLRNVEVLILTGTTISDRGLEHLAAMTKLKVLCLEETGITDGGLPQLKDFSNLGWLNVSSTRVTGVGLRPLWDCPALKVLIHDPRPVGHEGPTDRQGAPPSLEIYDGSRRRPAFHAFAQEHLRRSEP